MHYETMRKKTIVRAGQGHIVEGPTMGRYDYYC